jgi:hypothetical protein
MDGASSFGVLYRSGYLDGAVSRWPRYPLYAKVVADKEAGP